MRARVQFLGPVFGAELDEVMARASIFALPSYIENMPVSIMEAMATGLPVIATTVGAIPEMIEDGVTGRLVPPGDVGRLQNALAGLLDDPVERQRLGAAARAASVRWDRDTVGAATSAVYAEVISRHHG
jgi:glycosyltransferase involved in cell wall biosynthesis